MTESLSDMILHGLYLLSFLFVYILTKKWNISAKIRKNVQVVSCFFLLFIFFGFRDIGILNDTAHYYEHFQKNICYADFVKSKIWEYDSYDRFEAGYLIYENIVGHLWNNPYAIIMISSWIITVTWIYFVKDENVPVALIFFVIMVSGIINIHYSGIRQGLAVCIFFLAFKQFYQKNKLFYFTLACIFAYTFHSSALVLFLIIFLRNLQLNKKNIRAFLVGFVLLAFSLNYIFEILGFSGSIYYTEAQERETLPIAHIFIVVYSSLMMILSRKSELNRTKKYEIYWWLSLLNIGFRFLSVFIGILGRYTNYFAIFTIVLFVNSLVECENKGKHIALILVLFAYVFVSLHLRPEWSHLIPYSFYDFNLNYHNTDTGY